MVCDAGRAGGRWVVATRLAGGSTEEVYVVVFVFCSLFVAGVLDPVTIVFLSESEAGWLRW